MGVASSKGNSGSSCFEMCRATSRKHEAPPRSSALQQSAEKALSAHKIGHALSASKDVELFQGFSTDPNSKQYQVEIENRFFEGYSHNNLDFSRPIRGILVDFKCDGMQMGMLIERLIANDEQYVFIGNPPPFNDGWHFTAVNDFEYPDEQQELNQSWRDIRVWHRVNYVPTLTADGSAALVPRECYDAKDPTASAIPIGADFHLSTIYCLGGLMAGTLIANVVKDGAPADELVKSHLKLGTTFATVGHGLGVLIGSGSKERSAFSGFEAAITTDQAHLMKITGMTGSGKNVWEQQNANGSKLVSASFWGCETAEEWFVLLGLGSSRHYEIDSSRQFKKTTTENVIELDLSKALGGPCTWDGAVPRTRKPRVAFFLDAAFDPVELYAAYALFTNSNIDVQFISHSAADKSQSIREVVSETVYGNSNYALQNCCIKVSTTPANVVSKDTHFDAFAIAGGHGPFHMMGDPAIVQILDKTEFGGALCHGSMVLIGSKWVRPEDKQGPNFTAFNGAWIYFRDVLDRYVAAKPGHVCEKNGLITGNSPVCAREWAQQLKAAIQARVPMVPMELPSLLSQRLQPNDLDQDGHLKDAEPNQAVLHATRTLCK